MVGLMRYFMLQNLDTLWREHLLNMDHMRDGIGLRGYGQKDPLQEYKKEGFAMFVSMLQSYEDETLSLLLRVRPMREKTVEELEEERKKQQEINLILSHGEDQGKPSTVKRAKDKVGRNDPCPCGSGKKYKKCCGAKKK